MCSSDLAAARDVGYALYVDLFYKVEYGADVYSGRTQKHVYRARAEAGIVLFKLRFVFAESFLTSE